MYGKYSLHEFCQIIKVTMGEVKNLVVFYQVDGKKLCDKGLGIVKKDL